MQAARRWGVIWPAALAGLVSGAAAGFLAAPDVIPVPGLFALSGMALGLLLGLLAAWRRASERAPRQWSPSIGTWPRSRRRGRWRRRRRAATPPPAGIRIRGTAAPGATGTERSGPSICGATGSGDGAHEIPEMWRRDRRNSARQDAWQPSDRRERGLGACGARVTGAWSRFAVPAPYAQTAASGGQRRCNARRGQAHARIPRPLARRRVRRWRRESTRRWGAPALSRSWRADG